MEIVIYIAIALGAYLIGSISPSIIISNHFAKKDIREFGSGNAGSTNMLRTFGIKMGAATFVLDFLKGLICSALGFTFGGGLGRAIALVCVVIGHSFPVYYRFKGGKGVATSMGAMLMISPLHSLVCYLIAIATIFITGIVSVASLLGFLLVTICYCIVFPGLATLPEMIAIVFITLLVFYQHRENIKRILKGKENKFSFKKKKD